MRKEVQLSHGLIRDLKVLAFHADKSVKRMMEDILKNYIDEHTAIAKKTLPSP